MQNVGSGAAPLPGLAQLWRLNRGEHPSLPAALPVMSSLPPMPGPDRYPALAAADLPLAFAHSGHHLMCDVGYLASTGENQADVWPIAPVYVRDMAGRVLHTGLQPITDVPGPLTPVTCTALPPEVPGADLLEKTFLVHLRRLELAPLPGTPLAASEGKRLARALYLAPQRYPYKLRIDSFYQDGFRLPQLARLHVQNANPATSANAAADFAARWQQRPIGQSYDGFYEAQGGQAWYDKLFAEGCTVIPTVEAYNGWFQVTADYGMADVWPGRAVSGLHQVVGEEPADSPPGTIIRVVEPGYATRQMVQPAKVIVSTGSGYKAMEGPRPLLPDLRLPHQRTGGQWASTWLPTHPAHFVQPALYDWDPQGHFVQTAGPLWDPLHYVYTSTPQILRALRRPLEGAPYLAAVPEAMQPRFHPVCVVNGYDTPNQRTGQERARSYAAASPLAASALDHVALGREVAGIGYHPLPAALEYEMDSATTPQLTPGRFGACPPELYERLAPVIQSKVTGDEARRLAVGGTDPAWQIVTHPRLYPASTGEPFRDYPQLARFSQSDKGDPPSLVELARCLPVYLPELAPTELFQNLKRVFGNKGYQAALAAVGAGEGFAQKMQDWREAALTWRRLRYRMWRKHPAFYAQLWATLQKLTEPAGTTPPEQESTILAAILGQFGIQTLPPRAAKLKSTAVNQPSEHV